MKNLPHFEIRTGMSLVGGSVKMNGEDLPAVRGISVNQHVDDIAEVTIRFLGTVDWKVVERLGRTDTGEEPQEPDHQGPEGV